MTTFPPSLITFKVTTVAPESVYDPNAAENIWFQPFHI